MVEDTIPDTHESQTATVDNPPAAPEAAPSPDIVATEAAAALVTAPVFDPAPDPEPEPVLAVLAPEPEPVLAVSAPLVSEVVALPEPEPAAIVQAPPEVKPEPEAKPQPKKKSKVPEPLPAAPAEESHEKRWYAVKVQSNREDTIKEAIDRRVKKEGLDEFYGQIVIPVEKYTEVKQDKNGRKVTRTKERKLYPGYLFVELEYNDRMLYLFRETPGVGDFVGSNPNKLDRAPSPMSDVEVKRILGGGKKEDEPSDVPAPPQGLGVGDRVKVVDGIFNGQEGIIKHVLDTVGKFQVEVSIFGRPVSVDVEYYQVEGI